MKKLLLLLSLLLLLGFTGTASALSFTDTYDAGDLYMAAESYPDIPGITDVSFESWQFDIAQYGFKPDVMIITDATVGLYVSWAAKDDEYVEVNVSPNLGDPDNIYNLELNDGLNTVIVANLTSIQNNGKTMMELTALDGRFIFHEAVLNVSTAPVPEPATMMLFSIGLLGLAGVSRRKK